MTGEQDRSTRPVPAEDPEAARPVQVRVPGTVIELPERGPCAEPAGGRVIDTSPERRGTQSLVVEFAGLRGVGKSTLIPLVASELRRRGISVGGPRLRRSAKIAIAVRTLGPRLRVRWRLQPWSPWSQAARRFDRRLTRYIYRRLGAALHPGVHLVDEGISQLLMTVHFHGARGDPPAQWEALVEMLSLPDVIVLISADDRAIELRRTARGSAEDRRSLRPAPHEHAAMGSLERYLSQRRLHPSLELIHLAANGDPALLARVVADEIERRRGT